MPPCRTQLGIKRFFAQRVCPCAGLAAPPGAFPLPEVPPKPPEGRGCSRSALLWVPADTRGTGLHASRPPPGPAARRAASHRASERPSHHKGEQRGVPPRSPPTRVPTTHLRAGGGGGRGEGGSSSPWSRRCEQPRTEGGRDGGRRRGEASPAPLTARSGTESAAAPAGTGTAQPPLPPPPASPWLQTPRGDREKPRRPFLGTVLWLQLPSAGPPPSGLIGIGRFYVVTSPGVSGTGFPRLVSLARSLATDSLARLMLKRFSDFFVWGNHPSSASPDLLQPLSWKSLPSLRAEGNG